MFLYKAVLSFTFALSCIVAAFAYPGRTSRLQQNQCSIESFPRSINDFGHELSKQLDGQGNFFISPLSIYAALAMTYLGARGRTAEQIKAAILSKTERMEERELHRSFQKLLELYNSNNEEYSLLLANGIFLQKNSSVREQYVEDVRNFYHAMVKPLDFSRNGEAAKNEINQWVADNTRNKIEKFLKQPLDPLTQMALINAIYFKGTWKTQFDRESTSDGDFYKRGDVTQRVKYMSIHKTKFPFYEDMETGYKFLEMPYKGQDIVMLLALPRTSEDFPDFEMTSSALCRVNSSLRVRKMDSVIIPKFHLEYGTELNDALAKLGIKDMFTKGADLTGIRNERDLFVSAVLHKAVIDVNEEGSEAAAATGVFIMQLSLLPNFEFIANHPFLFYIVDKRNNMILFSGRVMDVQN